MVTAIQSVQLGAAFAPDAVLKSWVPQAQMLLWLIFGILILLVAVRPKVTAWKWKWKWEQWAAATAPNY